jgi:hypothetical protein
MNQNQFIQLQFQHFIRLQDIFFTNYVILSLVSLSECWLLMFERYDMVRCRAQLPSSVASYEISRNYYQSHFS